MPHPLQDDGRRWLGWHVGIRWMIRWMTLVAPRGVSGACLSQRVCVSVCVQVSLIKSQRIQRGAVSPVCAPSPAPAGDQVSSTGALPKVLPLIPVSPTAACARHPREPRPAPAPHMPGTGIPRTPLTLYPRTPHTETRGHGGRGWRWRPACGACGGGALPLASGHCALAWGAFCESFFFGLISACVRREREKVRPSARGAHTCARAPRRGRRPPRALRAHA